MKLPEIFKEYPRLMTLYIAILVLLFLLIAYIPYLVNL